MHVVMKPLKEAGERAVPMIDSKGNVHMNCCFLAAYISDKEEQALIFCLGGNSCTCCLAETDDLGNSQPCGLRTGQAILDKI